MTKHGQLDKEALNSEAVEKEHGLCNIDFAIQLPIWKSLPRKDFTCNFNMARDI